MGAFHDDAKVKETITSVDTNNNDKIELTELMAHKFEDPSKKPQPATGKDNTTSGTKDP